METKYFLSISLLALILSGCNYLDYSERSFAEQEDIFSSYNQTTTFLTGAYSSLQDGFSDVGSAMLESATDNSAYAWNNTNIQNFYNGVWSPVNTIAESWSPCYTGIHRANMFLLHAKDEVLDEFKWTGDGYQTKLKKWAIYRYEARFLRAFYHFELAKRYGDIPLVTTVLTSEEANNSTRESFDNVMEWIAQECTEIAPNLPVSFTSVPDQETGRVTRGAALALKARALLYSASPLHNPAGAPDYQQKWENAAKAAHDLIAAGLYNNSLPTWENVFNVWRAANTELIFECRMPNSRTFELANTSIGFEGGNSGNCPTQNLVDAFEMKSTGKGILEDGSGYDQDNPYADRDPRLAKTVLYNGSTWKGRTMDISYNGIDGLPKVGASPTGYYLRKYLVESTVISPPNMNQTEHCWIYFRYAEVLLNYAEAMNEAYGPNTTGEFTLTALDAVNYVRKRTGIDMPPYPAEITQSEFREKIRNERRVELAFEGHRMWDLRRWKQGEQTRNIYGMSIVNQESTITYTPVQIQTRQWDDKMYFFPIPQTEIYNTGGSLIQNPGW